MVLKQISGGFFVLLLISGNYAYAQVNQVSETSKVKPKEVMDSVISQNKKEVNSTIKDIRENVSLKESLPDSLPKLDKSKTRTLPKVDSVGVSYENGKLNLPDQFPSSMDEDGLRKRAKEKVSALPKTSVKKPRTYLPDTSSVPDKNELKKVDEKQLADKIPGEKIKQSEGKIKNLSDSLVQLAKKGEDLVHRKSLLQARKVYSEKALKKIYDSLGVSKLDSALALAASRKEVSKEELLTALNFSMPTSPVNAEPSSFRDLPEVNKLQEEISKPDLSSMKLPQDVLSELPPMRGLQFPADKFPLLDSIRKLNLSREDLSLKEEEVKQGVERVVAKKKPKFWDKTYVEGVVSYLKHKDANLLQVAPALGFRIKGNFSMGLGPNVLIKEEDKKWNVFVGYRSFAKLEFLSQRAYLQAEDVVDPGGISREYLTKMKHSILMGGGFLLPISRVVSINFSLLYRVNNDAYSGGQISPWVFRLGLSSVKAGKK